MFADINAWWRANADAGRASVLIGYSFGKAQRILAGVDPSIGPIVVHGAVEPLNAPTAPPASRCRTRAWSTEVKDKADLRRALVVCPPRAVRQPWMRRFGDARRLRQRLDAGARQPAPRRLDRGFVLSDHADWPGLQAIAATGARA